MTLALALIEYRLFVSNNYDTITITATSRSTIPNPLNKQALKQQVGMILLLPAPVLLLQTQPTKLIKNMAGLKYLICCLICHRGPVGLCTCFNLGRSGVQTLLSSTLLAIEKRKGKKRRMKSVPTKDDDILEMRRNCDLITCQYNVGCA